ncbi:MAG: hypothetical protein H6Q74_339 [Firmicutes bacterium]|nr:hypothetical protein [Bacillota bacterium]
MIKKSIVLMLLLLSYAMPVFAADDTPIINSGKQYIDDTMNKVFESYNGDHYNITYNEPDATMGLPGYWAKITGSVEHNYKVDVHKTEAEQPTYVANIEVNFDYIFYQVYLTQQEAEASKDVVQTTTDNYKFTLTYQAGQWIITDAQKYDSLLNKWFTINTKDLYEELKCKYENH